MAKNEDIGKNLEKLWGQTQKQLKKMADEAIVLTKKGEKQLRTVTEKGKIQTEILILKTKREQLYYQLGKLAASSSSTRNKRMATMRTKIADINKQVIAKQALLKTK